MSGQRRHEGTYDSHPGFYSSQREQYKIWIPRPPNNLDRVSQKATFESANQRATVSRRVDGRQHASGHTDRPDAQAAYPTTSSAYPTTNTTRRTAGPTSRSQSRSRSTVPQPPVAYPQNQTHAPPRSQVEMPEMHDLRDHLRKRAPAVPTPRSSSEHISGGDEAIKANRQRNTSRPPAPTPRNPPGQYPPDYARPYGSSREERRREQRYDEVDGNKADHRYGGREWPTEKVKIKETDRYPDRDLDRLAGNERERERATYTQKAEETDREQEEYRRYSRPSFRSRDVPDRRIDDNNNPDNVGQTTRVPPPNHRRYRSEDVAPSTSTRAAPSTTTPMAQGYSSAALSAQSRVPSQTPFLANPPTSSLHGYAPPPTPQISSVRLAGKDVKSSRTHHDRSSSLPPDLPAAAQSGSDTEKVRRREIRNRAANDPSNLRGPYMEAPTGIPRNRSRSREPSNQVGTTQATTMTRLDSIAATDPKFSVPRQQRLSETQPSSRPFNAAVEPSTGISAKKPTGLWPPPYDQPNQAGDTHWQSVPISRLDKATKESQMLGSRQQLVPEATPPTRSPNDPSVSASRNKSSGSPLLGQPRQVGNAQPVSMNRRDSIAPAEAESWSFRPRRSSKAKLPAELPDAPVEPVIVVSGKKPSGSPPQDVGNIPPASERPQNSVALTERPKDYSSRSQQPLESKPSAQVPDPPLRPAVPFPGDSAERSRQKDVVPQFPPASSRPENRANPSPTYSPPTDVNSQSKEYLPHGKPWHNVTTSAPVVPFPTVEVRTVITPAIQLPPSAMSSQMVFPNAFDEVVYLRDTRLRSATRDMAVEPTLPPAPPPTRSSSYNIATNDPHPVPPVSGSRESPVVISSKQVVLPSQPPPPRTTPRDDRVVPGQNPTCSAAPSTQTPFPNIPTHPPRQVLSSQTTGQIPSIVTTLVEPDPRSVPLSQPLQSSQAASRIQPENSPPYAPSHVPTTNNVSWQARSEDRLSTAPVPVVGVAIVSHSPVTTKAPIPQTDRRLAQPVNSQVNGQDLPPVATIVRAVAEPDLEGKTGMPTQVTGESSRYSPEIGKHRSRTKSIRLPASGQMVQNDAGAQRDLEEQDRSHLQHTASTSYVEPPVKSVSSGSAAKQKPSAVPQLYVPSPQPSIRPCNGQLEAEAKSGQPVYNSVSTAQAIFNPFVPPTLSGVERESQPVVPQPFVPAPPLASTPGSAVVPADVGRSSEQPKVDLVYNLRANAGQPRASNSLVTDSKTPLAPVPQPALKSVDRPPNVVEQSLPRSLATAKAPQVHLGSTDHATDHDAGAGSPTAMVPQSSAQVEGAPKSLNKPPFTEGSKALAVDLVQTLQTKSVSVGHPDLVVRPRMPLDPPLPVSAVQSTLNDRPRVEKRSEPSPSLPVPAVQSTPNDRPRVERRSELPVPAVQPTSNDYPRVEKRPEPSPVPAVHSTLNDRPRIEKRSEPSPPQTVDVPQRNPEALAQPDPTDGVMKPVRPVPSSPPRLPKVNVQGEPRPPQPGVVSQDNISPNAQPISDPAPMSYPSVAPRQFISEYIAAAENLDAPVKPRRVPLPSTAIGTEPDVGVEIPSTIRNTKNVRDNAVAQTSLTENSTAKQNQAEWKSIPTVASKSNNRRSDIAVSGARDLTKDGLNRNLGVVPESPKLHQFSGTARDHMQSSEVPFPAGPARPNHALNEADSQIWAKQESPRQTRQPDERLTEQNPSLALEGPSIQKHSRAVRDRRKSTERPSAPIVQLPDRSEVEVPKAAIPAPQITLVSHQQVPSSQQVETEKKVPVNGSPDMQRSSRTKSARDNREELSQQIASAALSHSGGVATPEITVPIVQFATRQAAVPEATPVDQNPKRTKEGPALPGPSTSFAQQGETFETRRPARQSPQIGKAPIQPFSTSTRVTDAPVDAMTGSNATVPHVAQRTPQQIRLAELLSSNPPPSRADLPEQSSLPGKSSDRNSLTGNPRERETSEKVHPVNSIPTPDGRSTVPPLRVPPTQAPRIGSNAMQASKMPTLDTAMVLQHTAPPAPTFPKWDVKPIVEDQRTELPAAYNRPPINGSATREVGKETAMSTTNPVAHVNSLAAVRHTTESSPPPHPSLQRFPIDDNVVQSSVPHFPAAKPPSPVVTRVPHATKDNTAADPVPLPAPAPPTTVSAPVSSLHNPESNKSPQVEMKPISSGAVLQHRSKKVEVVSVPPPTTLQGFDSLSLTPPAQRATIIASVPAFVKAQPDSKRLTDQTPSPPSGPMTTLQYPSRPPLVEDALPAATTTNPSSQAKSSVHRLAPPDTRAPIAADTSESQAVSRNPPSTTNAASRPYNPPSLPKHSDPTVVAGRASDPYQSDARVQSSQPQVSGTAQRPHENVKGVASAIQATSGNSSAVPPLLNQAPAHDSQVRPRALSSTSVYRSSKLNFLPPVSTDPVVSTVTRKAPEPYPSELRSQMPAPGMPLPQTSAAPSKIQGSSKVIHSSNQDALERVVRPSTSTGVYTTSRSRETSSRTRDPSSTALPTNVSNPSSSNIYSERSRQPVYSHTPSQSLSTSIQAQATVSVTSASHPSTAAPQPRSTTVRTIPPPTPHISSQSNLPGPSHASQATAADSTRTPLYGQVPPTVSTKKSHPDRGMLSDSEVLRKHPPSSKLASANVPQPTPPPRQPTPDSRKKNNIFGLFRGRTSDPLHGSPPEHKHPSSTVKASERGTGELGPETRPSSKSTSAPVTAVKGSSRSKSRAPAPMAVSVPLPDLAPSGRRSPVPTVFTPFRFVSAHRYRTVSAASLEALDGTATNTVVGSPTVSILSQTPILPPIRDPFLATQEWRNKEEADLLLRGKGRRSRPGVVFQE